MVPAALQKNQHAVLYGMHSYAEVVLARIRALPHGDRLLHMTRVGAVGLVGLIVQTSIFEIVGIQLDLLRPSTAALIGGEIAVLLGFMLNNHFNFPDRVTPLYLRLIRFHTVVAGSLFIQWLLVRIAEMYFPDAPLMLRAAYFTGILLGFLSNYIGYTLWVWRRH